MNRRALLMLGLIVAAAAWPVQAAPAQAGVAQLIAEARKQIDELNSDSAAALLRVALEDRSGATQPERTRALVLLGITELTTGRTESARRAFREALLMDPTQHIDTLAELHESLRVTFEGERAALRGTLELRGAPPGARVTIDDAGWAALRGQLPPGTHRVAVTARGYLPFRDTVLVPPGTTVLLTVALQRAEPARLSVSSIPWGIVFLDSQRLGETPVFEREVTPGGYTLRIEGGGRTAPLERQVELEPGALTRLGWLGSERATFPTARSARADSLFGQLVLDSALVAYVALAAEAGLSGTERARAAARAGFIYFVSGRERGMPALLDTARVYFRRVQALAPGYSSGEADWSPELQAALDAERPQVSPVASAVSGVRGRSADRGRTLAISLSPSLLIANDQALTGYLASRVAAPGDAPTRGFLGGVARAGYNINAHVMVEGVLALGQTDGLTWVAPSLSLSFGSSLNTATSAYVLAGVGLSRWTGNGPAEKAQSLDIVGGAGLRRFVSRHIALNIEWRVLRASLGEEDFQALNTAMSAGLMFVTGSDR